MTKKQYPAARLDKFLHSAPQFRPIRRGARKKGIEREYFSSDRTKKLTIRLFYELDIADQDLLLCLIAMSSAHHKSTIISPTPTKPIFIGLRDKLELDGQSVTKMDTIASHATAYEILKEMGKGTGKSQYGWLRDSLTRLSHVSFELETETEINFFHLMSFSGSMEEKQLKEIHFSINPYSARAVLGGSGGYTLVHREERAALYSEEARALHSILSGLVDMGRERVFLVDTLCDKVYSRYYDEAISRSAAAKRRRKLLVAFVEIDFLGYWDCFMSGRGKLLSAKVKRKKRK